MDFICLLDCNNREANQYNNDKVYYYKKWQTYQYYITSHYLRNTIYTDKGNTYCGWVTNIFISENFIAKSEFDLLLSEIDGLFEGYLIQ